MGAWAENAMGNDTALDWLGVTLNKSKIFSYIEKGLRDRDNDRARAAAFFLERFAYLLEGLGYDIEYQTVHSLLVLGMSRLEKILYDEAWINTWEDTKAIKKEIKEQIKQLRILSK